TVTDDELALAAADRDHRIDRLDARLQRLLHGLAADDARGLHLDAAAVTGLDRPLAVDGLTEGVHHAADDRLTHRHLGDAPGAAHDVAFPHARRVAEDGHADVVLLEVQDEPVHATRELDELSGEGRLEPVDARDAVTRAEHRAGLADEGGAVEVLDLLLDDRGDLVGTELHGCLSDWLWKARLRSGRNGRGAAGSAARSRTLREEPALHLGETTPDRAV